MGLSQFLGLTSNTSNTETPTTESTNPTAEYIQNQIHSHTVVIFSKTYCGFCTRTKRLLAPLVDETNQKNGTNGSDASNGITLKIIELDQEPNGTQIQNELRKMSGQSTVPNVYVRGEHIGGNDDSHAAFRSGRLQKLLEGE